MRNDRIISLLCQYSDRKTRTLTVDADTYISIAELIGEFFPIVCHCFYRNVSEKEALQLRRISQELSYGILESLLKGVKQ